MQIEETIYNEVKNNKEITNIKETILYNNKDLLEWINIERIGMKYIINIEAKVNQNSLTKNIIKRRDFQAIGRRKPRLFLFF